jgi:prepilin-type processing-associated H-X9-DG protein
MQYSLSTLFLVIFMVAASLAMLNYCEDHDLAVFLGFILIFFNATIVLAAVCINRASKFLSGMMYAVFILFFGIICSALLLPCYSKASNAAFRAHCANNLKQIGLALHNYHDVNKHFPPVNICDKNGKPLFSWRVEILPMIEYGSLYDTLKKEEPWNSPSNTKLLGQLFIPEYKCSTAHVNANDYTTNYVAVIGPGTAWRDDGPVKLADLPYNGTRAVMAIEVANSGVHWAEPRDLTVEEAIEGLKTGKGLRISTAHSNRINVLFADGHVSSMPSKMPISLWRKLFAGELGSIEELPDESAPDMVDVSIRPSPYEPGKWAIILGAIVWLLSVVLLFRRAIKSRRKPVAVNISKESVG